MSRSPIRITDHALVRWLERSGALDVEAIRTSLAASLARAMAAADAIGADEYLILADGLVYVVRESTLRTVLVEDGRHTHVRVLASRPSSGGEAASVPE